MAPSGFESVVGHLSPPSAAMSIGLEEEVDVEGPPIDRYVKFFSSVCSWAGRIVCRQRVFCSAGTARIFSTSLTNVLVEISHHVSLATGISLFAKVLSSIPTNAQPSLFSERVVTVLVGPSRTTWRLHENLLSCSSDFFKSAFNAGFKETFEDRLALPEDDPHAFELFVRWLYARATTPPPGGAAAAALSLHTPHPLIQTWLRLYALACKLMVEELENTCVDAAWRHYNVGMRRPDIRDVQYMYENTPEGSGMRRLLKERLTLGMFRGRQNNPVTAEWRDVLNETPDLGFDIVSEISGFHWISGGNAPARTGRAECDFHRHEKGERCRPG